MRRCHVLTDEYYTIEQLRSLVEGGCQIELSDPLRRSIAKGASYISEIQSRDEPIYGVNTGFGSLCNRRISLTDLSELQHRQLLSHACGVGPPISPELAKLTMAIKLLTFRTGHCGISLEVVERLIAHFNHDVVPVIPRKGTVGASGDLAPLAHMSLPIIGEGSVYLEGQMLPTAEALRRLGWSPLRLKAKEGLALTNGIQYLDAIAVQALWHIEELAKAADVIGSLSMQAFSCASSFYQVDLHQLSRHPERVSVARNLTKLLEQSNHAQLPGSDPAREDPYSFRCVPQVHGAIRQTIAHARRIVEQDCNSVSDNPLFFADTDRVLTCGNLHGESVAFVMDYLAIAVTELVNISERRTYQLLSGQHGLPPFLIKEPGLNSGLMIPQYTAAALLNECKVKCTPASIDTIPTCHLQEDHVSMGGTSGYKLQEVIENAEYVLAIELMTALQGIDLNPQLRLSPFATRVRREFRAQLPVLERDRLQSEDINKSHAFLRQQRRAWAELLE